MTSFVKKIHNEYVASIENGDSVEKIIKRRRVFKAFEAKSLANRNLSEKVADHITSAFGSFSFFLLNLYWFIIWITLNIGIIPSVKPFDPFPFGLLTMIVSLEAIFLSIFVLVSQNRAAQTDRLRDELHLQVNLIAEEEITKTLELLSEIRNKLGIKRGDPELEKMLHRIDTSYIEQTLQKQIENVSLDKIDLMNIKTAIPTVKTENKHEKKEKE